MYLHFQNWSEDWLLERLDRRQVEHGNRIIKVFASDEDPRQVLGRSALTVVDGNPAAFTDRESYEYPDRPTLSGGELESQLGQLGLGDLGQRSVRALFRFSNQEGFCQAAMAATIESGWLAEHPFECVDGIDAAVGNPSRERAIHLDIFFRESLDHLLDIVDYDKPEEVLTMREGGRFVRGEAGV